MEKLVATEFKIYSFCYSGYIYFKKKEAFFEISVWIQLNVWIVEFHYLGDYTVKVVFFVFFENGTNHVKQIRIVHTKLPARQ